MCGTDLREVVRGPASSALWQASACWGEAAARLPGCLTGESEERETWTAESLRTAITERATFLRCGHGRDFGGRRFRYIADLLSLRAQARGGNRSVGGP